MTLAGQKVIPIDAGVELPRVYMVWPTPAEYRPGDGELDIVAEVLTSGKTSRLYKRLVYDLQIAQDVSAHQSSAQLGSQFSITATAQPKHTADELQKAIDDELGKLFTGGITDEELARVKTGFVSGVVFEIERDATRANKINGYNQTARDPAYLAKDLARYSEATKDQVVAAAKRWLPLDRRVVAVVTPKKGAPMAGVLAGGGK